MEDRQMEITEVDIAFGKPRGARRSLALPRSDRASPVGNFASIFSGQSIFGTMRRACRRREPCATPVKASARMGLRFTGALAFAANSKKFTRLPKRPQTGNRTGEIASDYYFRRTRGEYHGMD